MIPVRTKTSGIFEMLVRVGDEVAKGQPLARILDPYDGEVKETLVSPANAMIFFEHDEPLTYANTAVIKLVVRES